MPANTICFPNFVNSCFLFANYQILVGQILNDTLDKPTSKIKIIIDSLFPPALSSALNLKKKKKKQCVCIGQIWEKIKIEVQLIGYKKLYSTEIGIL